MTETIYESREVTACVGLIHFLKSRGLLQEAFQQYEHEMKRDRLKVEHIYDGRVLVTEMEEK